jgi:hypothetical protein
MRKEVTFRGLYLFKGYWSDTLITEESKTGVWGLTGNQPDPTNTNTYSNTESHQGGFTTPRRIRV